MKKEEEELQKPERQNLFVTLDWKIFSPNKTTQTNH